MGISRQVILCLVVVAGFALLGAPRAMAQVANVRTNRLVSDAEARAVEYFRSFKDLTAEETKTVEEFRASGEVSRRRRIVSSLIVYRSQLDNGSMAEYRDVYEVDGAPVAGRQERVLALFEKQGRAKSVREELDRINREGSRYDLDYTVTGLSLAQGLPLQPWARALFDFEIEGTELVAGRPATRVAYRQAAPGARFGFDLSLPGDLKRLTPLYRGRVWLDAETAHVLREDREVVVEPLTGPPLVVQRVEFLYEPSRFGISLPTRIVLSSHTRFGKSPSGAATSALKYRITFAYGPFRQFTAEAESSEIARVLEDDAAPPEEVVEDLGPEFGPDAPLGPPEPPAPRAPAVSIAGVAPPASSALPLPTAAPSPAARSDVAAPAPPEPIRERPRPVRPPPARSSGASLPLGGPPVATLPSPERAVRPEVTTPSAPPPPVVARATTRPPRIFVAFLALQLPASPVPAAPPARVSVPLMRPDRAPAPPADAGPPRFRRPPPSR